VNDLTERMQIQLRDDKTLHFENFDEARSWLENERNAFNWLIDGGSAAGSQVGELRKLYVRAFSSLQEALNEPDKAVRSKKFTDQFNYHYANARLLPSDHSFARISAAIGKRDGAVAAAAAFAVLLGIITDLNFETLKGILAATLWRDGIQPDSSNTVSEAIAALRTSADSDRNKQWAEHERLTAEAKALLSSTQETFEVQRADFAEDTLKTAADFQASVDAALESIRRTESAYNEQMKLQAPVAYWNEKLRSHRAAASSSLKWLIGYTIAGALLLLLALVSLASRAASLATTSPSDTAIYLKFAAIGAVLTTIVFWVGRVLLRIYLSNRHLITDAEERKAMLQTYLALTKDGRIEATDRALVLGPLFRSAADGIVKDDGPDSSVAAIIARAIEAKGR